MNNFKLIMDFKLGLILSLAFLLLNCSNNNFTRTGTDREGKPDQESWQVKITLTSEGIKRAVINSGHLEKYKDKQKIFLNDGVNADFFDENERHTSKLISRIAEVDEKSNFMVAIGDVSIISDSGITLFTDTISWNNSIEKVYTESAVMITTEKNDTLYGIGFESDVELNHWKIIKPTGVMHADKND